MKIVLIIFVILLWAPIVARSATVTGPAVGMDSTGTAWHIDYCPASPDAFAVYQRDAKGTPVEASGLFYFQGTTYAVGYAWAQLFLQHCGQTKQ